MTKQKLYIFYTIILFVIFFNILHWCIRVMFLKQTVIGYHYLIKILLWII